MKYLIVDMFLNEDKHEEFLHKLKVDEYDICLFFSASEWQYWFNSKDTIWSRTLDIIKFRGKKIDVITGAHKVLLGEPIDPEIRIHRWDTFWFSHTISMLNDIVDNSKYNYHYVYLNNRAHSWRQHLIDLVAKHDLLKHGAVSWHNHVSHMADYNYRYFKTREIKLTDSFDNNSTSMVNIFKPPLEYRQSFAQLISESNTATIFMTEKTCIPLILGKPFLVATAPNYHKFLESIGFESYTEIFDYSFDSELDQEKRFDNLLKNFDRLCKIPLQSLPDLYKTIEEKINRNKQHAINIGKNQLGKPSILNDIPNSVWKSNEWVYTKYISIAV